MRLEFMTTDTLDDLSANFPNYMHHYVDLDKDWFDAYFRKNDGLRLSKITCDDFELDKSPNDDMFAKSDLENVRILYSALMDLSPVQASDERLWAGLAHNQLWDYITYRRGDVIRSGDEAKIRNSFFFVHGVKRSCHVNTLARLWWAGYLTYDETREDPFELTPLLDSTGFASTVVLLSSSNMTENRELCLGILESLRKREEAGEDLKRMEHLVPALKYLNTMGSITILDLLDRNDVTRIIDRFFEERFGKI